ncbi:MAG: hypothetical protein P0Y60_10245 [Candidatus Microbacterium colombiense]|nr:MAG: hypothetical protein P0Y60_10245 [Microbacterium sp.]
MTQVKPAREWVHIWEHLHAVRVGKAWRAAAITLIAAVGVAAVLSGIAVARGLFGPMDGLAVVPAPRDCRVTQELSRADVFVAVDVSAISGGSLTEVEAFAGSDATVDSAVLVPRLDALDTMTDAEIETLGEEAAEEGTWMPADGSEDYVLLIIAHVSRPLDTIRLTGVRTRWVLGEPWIEQVIPLGVEFTKGECAVAVADH